LGGALFKFALFGINSSDLSKKKRKKEAIYTKRLKRAKSPANFTDPI
jgi:hypothetical protein